MKIRYFDAHCHVQFGMYDNDREELIEKMAARGVGGLVVGCDRESSRTAVALASAHEHLFGAVGLHPNHEAGEQFDGSYYRELAKNEKVIAIGECGLDYFRPAIVDEVLKEKQQALFKEHVALAAELDKPLIIHSRPSKKTKDAYEDLIKILQEAKRAHPTLRGDVHFFVGDVAEMQALTALGFTVSFTAVITFAREYDSVIRATPSEMLLAETDAPYVPPVSREKGSRNDPLAVEDVVAKLAEIRGEDPEALRGAILENSTRLFGLSAL
jgi:TatD DNase family protein